VRFAVAHVERGGHGIDQRPDAGFLEVPNEFARVELEALGTAVADEFSAPPPELQPVSSE
jgi:hypothetical protein